MLTFTTRKQARAAGVTRYFSGEPCKHGHVCERYSKCGACVYCHRLANARIPKPATIAGVDTAAYHRAWYAQNVEKRRASSRAWRLRNPDKAREQLIKWEKENKETRRAIVRRRYLKSRDEINAKAREWSKNHMPRLIAKSALRKANKRKATPPWVDRKALTDIYENCPPGMHVDHVIPLRNKKVCGLHVPWNLQYLTPAENLAKGNRV